MKSFQVRSKSHSEMIEVTSEVARAVSETGVKDGACIVFVPHTTAGITINERADPDVQRDILQTLDRMVPWRGDYFHTEGNAAAHVKASLLGSSVMVLIEGGRLVLGTWQGIFFCEFDGPRQRKVYVQILPGA